MSDTQNEEHSLAVAPRENMITAAVRFLNNPTVGGGSDQQKMTFLKKKGLTDDEINEAFLRSSAVSYSVEQTTRTCTFMGARPGSRLLSALQAACHVIVVFCGGGYVIYYIVKTYVLPWLTGQRSKSAEDKLAKLQASLDESVRSMQTYLQNIHTQVEQQQRAVADLARPGSPDAAQIRREVSQLRAEISSLKALLLDRHQFPSVPSIPSWQLPQSSGSDEKRQAGSSSSGEIVIVSGHNSDHSDHNSDN